jgi:hypothetical protein
MVLIMNTMTIVDLDSETHSRLKKIKKVMKQVNPVFKVNNTVVINHALKRIEEGRKYELG